jgi:ADP-heptose:LPS heptosyltransferase
MTDQLLFILDQAFVLKPIASQERRPSLCIDEQVFNDTRDQLDTILRDNGSSEFIVINTQARNDFLEWGYDNSLDLAQQITQHYSHLSVVLTSSPEREQRLREAIATRHIGPRVLYFPTPDLHNLFSVIRLSTLVITPDTSAIHIASAERKPTVGFYPRPTNWPPYHVPGYMFSPRLDQPVGTIEIDNVFNAVSDLLDPDSQTIRDTLLHAIQA